MFGITRGEIVLIAFVFALIYGAGLLPRLSAWISRRVAPGRDADEKNGE
jgi:Sec-independent protein translocase protein TatA